MIRFHDISRPIDSEVAPWPGDTPFAFRKTWKMSEGSSVNVGALTASTHFSTHLDAPYHYDPTGTTVENLKLEAFYGEATVLDCRGASEINLDVIGDISLAPRVLFRTDCWLDSAVFPQNYPLLHADLPDLLAKKGVRLIGLDLPSVDSVESRELPIHHALNRANILILESLWLRDILPGDYQLIAFPLRLTGGDAAPVRAVLLETC